MIARYIFVLTVLLSAESSLRADSGAKAPSQEALSMEAPKIPDIEVVDQDGKTWRLYTDIIKGRRVAINFIFTSCTMICNPLGAIFSRLEKETKDQSDLKLLSLSLDPELDSPKALREFSSKFQGGPGWTLLTGKREAMERALQAFGASVAVKEQHGPLVLVGNDKNNRWLRFRGMVSSQRLKESLNSVL